MKVSRMSRRLLPPLVLALALGIAPAVAMAPAAPMATSACATPWGSLVKQKAPYTGKQITNVRSGRHECFDRLVIDVNGDGKGAPGYSSPTSGPSRRRVPAQSSPSGAALG